MRNFVEKFVEKIETHSLRLITFFFFENRAVCETMLEYMVEPDRPQMIIHVIWRMHFARSITKATNTHLDNVNLIAFPRHQFCTKAPQFYVILILTLLFCLWYTHTQTYIYIYI
jgi:hypothetical protein